MEKKRLNPLAIVLGSILLLYTLLLFIFLIYVAYNSFKTRFNFFMDPLGLPKGEYYLGDYTWYSQYLTVFTKAKVPYHLNGKRYEADFIKMFGNSLLYSVGCAFTATLVPCLVAYVTAKYRFVFNKVIYYIVIFAMVTPIVGSGPSQIFVMDEIFGIYDTIPGMWFMSANFLGTYYLVFYGIFKGLSWEYAEAAFIDGASHLNVMLRVMFPLVRTTFGVIMLLNFIAFWNNYQTPIMFIPSHPTMAVALQYLGVRGAGDADMKWVPARFAFTTVIIVPSLTLFIIFRNKLAGNLTVGGIKG